MRASELKSWWAVEWDFEKWSFHVHPLVDVLHRNYQGLLNGTKPTSCVLAVLARVEDAQSYVSGLKSLVAELNRRKAAAKDGP